MKYSKAAWAIVIAALVLGGGLLGLARPAGAAAVLNIQPITWNVIGLDSNKVTDGPDLFQVGARVCNIGDQEATNVTVSFIRDGTLNPYISPVGSTVLTLASLPFGTGALPPGNTGPLPANCADFYFNIRITRDAAAYLTTQIYHVEATADGLGTVSTPANRELYIEKLLDQSRNSITSLQGPQTVYVGETYQYTVVADTAPNGYEQLVTTVDFPNTMFQILAVNVSYTGPTSTNNTTYADACGWNNDRTSPTYRSCVGPQNYPGGKVGGTVTMVYTVKILSPGTATLMPLIYDFSGSSYHYNSDYGKVVLSITAENPTAVKLLSFTGRPAAQAIVLQWETASEEDNAGFNLYRREIGTTALVRVNDTLIPSLVPGQGQGAGYEFVDADVTAGVTYEYLLEDVDLSGERGQHGPVTVKAPYAVFMPLLFR